MEQGETCHLPLAATPMYLHGAAPHLETMQNQHMSSRRWLCTTRGRSMWSSILTGPSPTSTSHPRNVLLLPCLHLPPLQTLPSPNSCGDQDQPAHLTFFPVRMVEQGGRYTFVRQTNSPQQWCWSALQHICNSFGLCASPRTSQDYTLTLLPYIGFFLFLLL